MHAAVETQQISLDFGDLAIRLDPWQVDYGDQTLVESPSAEADKGVDVDLEMAGAWKPIVPDTAEEPGQLIFVDGVRRLEARLIVQGPDGLAHGIFASYAVGSVELTPHAGAAGDAAAFGPARVERVILLGSDLKARGEVAIAPGLIFRPESTDDERPEAPVDEVQNLMQRAEAKLVRERAADEALVIADGPLHFEELFRKQAVGYIKRFAQLYLPVSRLAVLTRLPAGGRTPLFALHRGGFGRFAWYLRLAAPAPGESGLAGLVRLEVAAALGLDVARRLADATCGFLPALSTRPWQDPRAPQNLVPIGALERQLIRLLGDRLFVRRQIETHMARETRPARRAI